MSNPVPWNDIPPDQQADALAEKLGWHKEERDYTWLPVGPVRGTLWVDDNGESMVLVDQFKPQTDLNSMGLVIEAMAKRDWERQLFHYPSGHVKATFYKGFLYRAFATDHNEPAAVAKAAWKALGGE